MLKRVLLRLVAHPVLLDVVRWMIEAGHRSEKKVIRKEFADFKGSLLDVPSGTGVYSAFFSQNQYIGVDLEEKFVHAAKKKFPSKHFSVMDALHMSFADETFDGVLTIGFLHHLDSELVNISIAEIARVLVHGGIFVLIEDCPTRSPWNVLGKILQSLDEGGKLRDRSFYEPILCKYLSLEKCYPLRAGVWDYNVYVLRKP